MIRNNVARVTFFVLLCVLFVPLFGMEQIKDKLVSDDDIQRFLLISHCHDSVLDDIVKENNKGLKFELEILTKMCLNHVQRHCEENDESIVRRKNITRDPIKFLDFKLDGSDVLFCNEEQLQALDILLSANTLPYGQKVFHKTSHFDLKKTFLRCYNNVPMCEISEEWFNIACSLPLSTREKFLIRKNGKDLDDLSILVVKNKQNSNQNNHNQIMKYGQYVFVGGCCGAAAYCLGKQCLQPSEFNVNDIQYVAATAGLGCLVGAGIGNKLLKDAARNTDGIEPFTKKSLFSESELEKVKLRSELRNELKEYRKKWNNTWDSRSEEKWNWRDVVPKE